jgi:drug/metabolite transporter (DMT)-like permease
MSDRTFPAAALLVAAGALLFSAKGVLIKGAYAYGVDPLTVLALRMLLALPAFLLIACRSGPPDRAPPRRRTFAAAAGIGLVGYHAAPLLDFHGLRFIGVGLERMVLYLYPTLVIAWAALRGRRRIDARLLLALIGTYAGIVLAWAGQAAPGPGTALGVALVAGSAAAFAAFVVVGDDLMRELGSQRFMSTAMSGAAIGVLCHHALTHPLSSYAVPAPVWVDALALAYLGTLAPSLLLAEGQRRLGAERASVIGTVGPVGTAIIGWIALGERPTLIAVAGMALTIAAVTWLSLGKAEPAVQPRAKAA